ncbi:DUF1697 domain-containing protein [soil metagenome]
MAKYVALLRGINVGRAKAISMAELAAVFTGLGYDDVRTVLRSGNVIFSSDHPLGVSAPTVIESAVFEATGVQSTVLVVPAAEFVAATQANPFAEVATDGSKLFVTFLHTLPADLELPDAAALAPELLAVGDRVVYQWMPDGSMQTRVPKGFWKQFPQPGTARNDNTLRKLVTLME